MFVVSIVAGVVCLLNCFHGIPLIRPAFLGTFPTLRFLAPLLPPRRCAEHEWKAERPSGSAKEDTAVIQFHSRSEINHSRFQGFGVVKKASGPTAVVWLGVVQFSSGSSLLLS